MIIHHITRRTIYRERDAHNDYLRLALADLSLWTRGAENALYPPPGSDVLRIPFHFTLPDNLPPSFHWTTIDESATIRYALTAVGVRKGLLNFDRKYVTPLAVLPKDDIGVRVKEGSERGEVHAWRTQKKEERIRKGLWGDYAKVEVEVRRSLPTMLHTTRDAHRTELFAFIALAPGHPRPPSLLDYPVYGPHRDDHSTAITVQGGRTVATACSARLPARSDVRRRA